MWMWVRSIVIPRFLVADQNSRGALASPGDRRGASNVALRDAFAGRHTGRGSASVEFGVGGPRSRVAQVDAVDVPVAAVGGVGGEYPGRGGDPRERRVVREDPEARERRPRVIVRAGERGEALDGERRVGESRGRTPARSTSRQGETLTNSDGVHVYGGSISPRSSAHRLVGGGRRHGGSPVYSGPRPTARQPDGGSEPAAPGGLGATYRAYRGAYKVHWTATGECIGCDSVDAHRSNRCPRVRVDPAPSTLDGTVKPHTRGRVGCDSLAHGFPPPPFSPRHIRTATARHTATTR